MSPSQLVPYEQVVRMYQERTGEVISTASARDAVVNALFKLRTAIALYYQQRGGA